MMLQTDKDKKLFSFIKNEGKAGIYVKISLWFIVLLTTFGVAVNRTQENYELKEKIVSYETIINELENQYKADIDDKNLIITNLKVELETQNSYIQDLEVNNSFLETRVMILEDTIYSVITDSNKAKEFLDEWLKKMEER